MSEEIGSRRGFFLRVILLYFALISPFIVATPIVLGMLLAMHHQGIEVFSRNFRPQNLGIGRQILGVIGCLLYLAQACGSAVYLFWGVNSNKKFGWYFKELRRRLLISVVIGTLVYLAFRIFV